MWGSSDRKIKVQFFTFLSQELGAITQVMPPDKSRCARLILIHYGEAEFQRFSYKFMFTVVTRNAFFSKLIRIASAHSVTGSSSDRFYFGQFQMNIWENQKTWCCLEVCLSTSISDDLLKQLWHRVLRHRHYLWLSCEVIFVHLTSWLTDCNQEATSSSVSFQNSISTFPQFTERSLQPLRFLHLILSSSSISWTTLTFIVLSRRLCTFSLKPPLHLQPNVAESLLFIKT